MSSPEPLHSQALPAHTIHLSNYQLPGPLLQLGCSPCWLQALSGTEVKIGDKSTGGNNLLEIFITFSSANISSNGIWLFLKCHPFYGVFVWCGAPFWIFQGLGLFAKRIPEREGGLEIFFWSILCKHFWENTGLHKSPIWKTNAGWMEDGDEFEIIFLEHRNISEVRLCIPAWGMLFSRHKNFHLVQNLIPLRTTTSNYLLPMKRSFSNEQWACTKKVQFDAEWSSANPSADWIT